MVKHHILIGLGFKKNNFRNRGLQRMLNRAGKAIMGSALPQNQMTIQPFTRPPPKFGGAITRRPLKFNY
jgi:hypothetical protein